MLEPLATTIGLMLIGIALLDAFETVVLPRRVTRQFRIARLFFVLTWRPWMKVAQAIPGRGRETYLSFFGPLALLLLVALWASLMIVGFGLVNWAVGSSVTPSGRDGGLGTYLYQSGTAFFTLGLGDVRPDSGFSRAITVIEAGSGFAFLALVVTYLPVLYQAFSRREINVTLLDARAGSPPSAGEFFRRLEVRGGSELVALLQDWERWAAELLETHLSYPLLTLYRSQHERQSWVAALTLILDVSAIVLAGGPPEAQMHARLTFAMARHAAVDLSQVLQTHPRRGVARLSPADFEALVGMAPALLSEIERGELDDLRSYYEPNVGALSDLLLMPLPGWLPTGAPDAWKSTPWI